MAQAPFLGENTVTSWDDLLPLDGGEEGEDWDRYMQSCARYLKRQILVYQHWPQKAFDEMGYQDETVFRDRNA